MRSGPLILIIVFVLIVGSNIGTTFLWVVAAIAIIALLVLIFVMARAQSFVGPRVVLDDVKERFESYGRDEPEAEPAQPVQPIANQDTL